MELLGAAILPTTTTKPKTERTFQTSGEMEALQQAFGGLRVLRPRSSADDESEAFYRRSVYDVYERCRGLLCTAATAPSTATATLQMHLGALDRDLHEYFEELASFEVYAEEAGAAYCLRCVAQLMDNFGDAVLRLFGAIQGVVDGLAATELEMLLAAIALEEALVWSAGDRILNGIECRRLLAALRDREAEIAAWLQRARVLVFDARETGRRLCLAAAAFLGDGKLRDEDGVGDVCAWVEEIAEMVGDHARAVGDEDRLGD